jgi:5'-nucleotidase (lipoprotein e(P4) family)
MKSHIFLLAAALFSASIVSAYVAAVSTAQVPTSPVLGNAENDYQMGGVLYMQKAAEYRALAYQAFNIARWRLDDDLDKKSIKKLPKPERKMARAVVVDIDETVLDNSPAQAYGVRNRLPFDIKTWYAWGEMRKAKAIPGAVDFLNYAESKGAHVFYVSNRDEVQKQATMDNLKSVGFTHISPDNVILRATESTKEPRRLAIAQKYRIVLLIGDNLDDFSNVFERKSILDRFAETDKARELFGKRFIVLPNAMYGTWENALYGYERLDEAQKAQRRRKLMELP